MVVNVIEVLVELREETEFEHANNLKKGTWLYFRLTHAYGRDSISLYGQE